MPDSVSRSSVAAIGRIVRVVPLHPASGPRKGPGRTATGRPRNVPDGQGADRPGEPCGRPRDEGQPVDPVQGQGRADGPRKPQGLPGGRVAGSVVYFVRSGWLYALRAGRLLKLPPATIDYYGHTAWPCTVTR